MTPAEKNHAPLPRYGIRDDEKTRPCIVLFDWNGDDEATARVHPIEPGAVTAPPPPVPDADAGDDIDVNQYGPRWSGIGRRPGAVALAITLGMSVAIGVFALFGPAEAQAGADVSAYSP